jgi:serine/threonine protein kinase
MIGSDGTQRAFGPVVDPPPLAADWSFPSQTGYRLIRRLGRGGMGEVWEAERRSAGGHAQKVAVKFISDPGTRPESLDAEALRMSRLSHDNIVPFIDSGLDAAGRFFVAMQFVDGMDLDGLRALTGLTADAAYRPGAFITRIPDQIVGFVMFMTLRALHYAHSFDFGQGVVGLVHRDVSPGNILIDEARGFVKLTDFGVAAVLGGMEASSGRQVVGKVPYMAPEVLIGDPTDARSDLYSLGLVAYELVTGFNPNLRPAALKSVIGSITEVMLSLERPLRPAHEVVEGVSPGLSAIFDKLIRKDPAQRYQSADAVLTDLSVFLYDRGFGPTTGSLSNYMAILRRPGDQVSQRARHSLRFLDWRDGVRVVVPRWKPTAAAAAALAAGENPARG